jgi:hypothetical protein
MFVGAEPGWFEYAVGCRLVGTGDDHGVAWSD